MNLPFALATRHLILAATVVILPIVAVGIGVAIVARWWRGVPIVPFARRRPVPWHGGEVLFVFLVCTLFLPGAAMYVVHNLPAAERVPAEIDSKLSMAHPAEQLLGTGNIAMIALAAFMAVIVAPITEELLFRVVFQGWLEAVWSRMRRLHPRLRAAPASWLPIALPALVFALMHVRSSKPSPGTELIAGMMVAQALSDVLAVLFIVGIMRYSCQATAEDLGWKPEKLADDARLGLLGLLAIAAPLIVVQALLVQLVKWSGISYVPDPLPLFLLALVFGTLYRRTHRLAPSLVLHASFNATSLLLYFAG